MEDGGEGRAAAAGDSNASSFVETLERRLFGRAPVDAEAAAAAAAAVASGDVEDQVILMAHSPFELRALEVALEMVRLSCRRSSHLPAHASAKICPHVRPP